MYSNLQNNSYSGDIYKAPGGQHDRNLKSNQSQTRFQNLGQSLIQSNNRYQNSYDNPGMYGRKHELDHNDQVQRVPAYMAKDYNSIVDVNRRSPADQIVGAVHDAVGMSNPDIKLQRLQNIREALENDQTRARGHNSYEQYRGPYQQQGDFSYNKAPQYQQPYLVQSNQIPNTNALYKLQQLKQDYIRQGGNNPTFLNNIQFLEETHKKNYSQPVNSAQQFLQNPQISYPNQQNLNYKVMNSLPNSIQDRLHSLEQENKKLSNLNNLNLNAALDILGPVRHMNEAQIIKYLWAQENSYIQQLQGINPLSTEHFIKDQQLAKIRELRLALELMHQGAQGQTQQISQHTGCNCGGSNQPQVIVLKQGQDQYQEKKQKDHPNEADSPKILVEKEMEIQTDAIEDGKKKKNDMGETQDSFLEDGDDDYGQGVIVKVMGLLNYNGKPEISCRNCIVDFKKVVNDLHGAPCAELVNLPGEQKGSNLATSHKKIYNFDYKGMLKNMSPAELRKVKWYVSLYDEETGEQLGWLLADMFRNEKGKMRINSGRFASNLYMPPAQTPPFEEPKVNMPIFCDYVIMEYHERQENLQLFDMVEEQEEDKDEKVLTIEIQSLQGNNISGDSFSFFNSLMIQEHALIDREGKQCEAEGPLKIVDRSANLIKFQHDNSYQVSDNLLRNQVKKHLRQESQAFIEILDGKGISVGIAPIPLFKVDDKTVNRGTHRVQLIKIDSQGREQNLNMVLQVRIELDENFDIDDKQYDPDKGLIVSLFELKNFKDKFDVSFQIRVINKDQLLIDMDGHPSDFESEDIYKKDKKRKNFIEFIESVEMPINWKKVRDDCQRKPRVMRNIGVQIRLTTIQQGKTICFAWLMHPLFTENGMLNKGKFNEVKLWEPPVKNHMPIDYTAVESEMLLNYEVDQCNINDSFYGAVEGSGSEDSLFDHVNRDYCAVYVNYIQDSNLSPSYKGLAVKLAMIENTQPLKDKRGQNGTAGGDAHSVKGSKTIIDEKFEFNNINLADLKKQQKSPPDKYFIVISLINQKGSIQFWGFVPLLNKNYNLRTGSQHIDLYLPPLKNPPLDIKKLKLAKAKCNLIVSYNLDELSSGGSDDD